jgi:D-arabinose 1-dehydrogenase-like Zn-dependent alcohol dehydrogenase
MLEPFIRARDNPDIAILWGAGVFGDDPRAKKLMEDSWREGMYAEYARAPLENCYALDEEVLCGKVEEGGLGYSVADLTSLTQSLVGYGGLRGIRLQAGETVIVAPATGGYSSATVGVAVAMGAKVIAVGRNLEVLRKVKAVHGTRVSIVQLKGSVEEDLAALQKFGSIDAYIDISPGVASDSTHVRSCIMAVKPYGRVSLMGVIHKDIAVPYVVAVLKNLTIRGQYMYEREDARGIIKLAETGVLKLGKSGGHELVAEYPLEEFDKALETAKNNPEAGKVVLFTP